MPSVKPTDVRSVSLVSTNSELNTWTGKLTPDVAFVNFVDRASAEKAAGALGLQEGIEIDGKKCKVVWGRARAAKSKATKTVS